MLYTPTRTLPCLHTCLGVGVVLYSSEEWGTGGQWDSDMLGVEGGGRGRCPYSLSTMYACMPLCMSLLPLSLYLSLYYISQTITTLILILVLWFSSSAGIPPAAIFTYLYLPVCVPPRLSGLPSFSSPSLTLTNATCTARYARRQRAATWFAARRCRRLLIVSARISPFRYRKPAAGVCLPAVVFCRARQLCLPL